jgi:hypothetical protein
MFEQAYFDTLRSLTPGPSRFRRRRSRRPIRGRRGWHPGAFGPLNAIAEIWLAMSSLEIADFTRR